MKKMILFILVFAMACTAEYETNKWLNKVNDINAKYIAENNWGPDAEVAPQGLQELVKFEEELVKRGEERHVQAVILVVRAYEKVYEASIFMGPYEEYEPDSNFCQISKNIIYASQEAGQSMKEAAAFAQLAATEYSNELGNSAQSIMELSATYSEIAKTLNDYINPYYVLLEKQQNC